MDAPRQGYASDRFRMPGAPEREALGTRHEASEPASVTFACRIGRLWCLTIGGLLIIVAFAAAILGGLV